MVAVVAVLVTFESPFPAVVPSTLAWPEFAAVAATATAPLCPPAVSELSSWESLPC